MPLVGLGLNQPTICSRDQRYDCRIRFSPFRHAPDPTIDYTQSDVRYVGKTKHFFGIVYGSMGALCVCADQSGRALRPPAVLELARKCFAMMSRRRRRRTQPALSRHVRFGREIPNAAGHHPKSSTSDSILMRVCFFIFWWLGQRTTRRRASIHRRTPLDAIQFAFFWSPTLAKIDCERPITPVGTREGFFSFSLYVVAGFLSGAGAWNFLWRLRTLPLGEGKIDSDLERWPNRGPVA